jgi:hypothetical protein
MGDPDLLCAQFVFRHEDIGSCIKNRVVCTLESKPHLTFWHRNLAFKF